MLLTIKDLQAYLGGVSFSTAERFKNEVLYSLGKKTKEDAGKKMRITAQDVALYHKVPLFDVIELTKR